MKRENPRISLKHLQARLPPSARMGCGLNPERLRTEPSSKHKRCQGVTGVGVALRNVFRGSEPVDNYLEIVCLQLGIFDAILSIIARLDQRVVLWKSF